MNNKTVFIRPIWKGNWFYNNSYCKELSKKADELSRLHTWDGINEIILNWFTEDGITFKFEGFDDTRILNWNTKRKEYIIIWYLNNEFIIARYNKKSFKDIWDAKIFFNCFAANEYKNIWQNEIYSKVTII